MGAVSDYFDAVNPLFGFFYDVSMASNMARKNIERIQREHGSSDDAAFIVGQGAPTGTPEQEIEKSLHATTIAAVKQRLADDGADTSTAANAVLVFAYHLWDEIYRHQLATERRLLPDQIKVNIFGDIRLLRNSLVHNKGIASADVSKCLSFRRFTPGERIELTRNDVATIIQLLREELRPYA